MNPVSFYGETSGSIAYKQALCQRNETTGSVGEKETTVENAAQYQGLDKDTVCFKGSENYDKKGTSPLAVLAYTGFTAAALVLGLGCAKKYNWIDKLADGKAKDCISKYAVNPAYDACKYVKTHVVNAYNKIKSHF